MSIKRGLWESSVKMCTNDPTTGMFDRSEKSGTLLSRWRFQSHQTLFFPNENILTICVILKLDRPRWFFRFGYLSLK